jgi:hypothetical protein
VTNAYKDYSIEDFDSFDCLKLSKRFYFVLLFVLRGYFVWLISVTNMRDRVGLMELVYPELDLFFLSLLSGTLGLFVVLIISLRRPDAPNWIQRSWRHCRTFLVIALLFDLLINSVAVLLLQLLPLSWLIAQALIVSALIALCFTSQRLTINLTEFPQKLPEK